MKPAPLLLSLALLVPGLFPRQEPQRDERAQEQGDGTEGKREPQRNRRRSDNATTRFFEDEAEELEHELEGTWMLLDYTDPFSSEYNTDPSGIATFHDGLLTWVIGIDTFTEDLLGVVPWLVLEAGGYRYRVDEQANLQLASILTYTNNTPGGRLQREPENTAFEYFTVLDDGVLELRDPEGQVMTFRKIGAGEFPDAAVRAIERLRSGTESWPVEEKR